MRKTGGLLVNVVICLFSAICPDEGPVSLQCGSRCISNAAVL